MLRVRAMRLFGFVLPAAPTPNPDCMQYRSTVDPFMPDHCTPVEIPSKAYAGVHPAATVLFDQYEQEVRSVFIAPSYVTVTKWHDVPWTSIIERGIGGLLANLVLVNDPVAPDAALLKELGATEEGHCFTPLPTDSEVMSCVKELMRTQVRPMVQRDGGDLRLAGFDETTGVLRLYLLGACRSCPSSQNTLKDGIERMLQHFVPEVREVKEEIDEATKQARIAKMLAAKDKKLKQRGQGFRETRSGTTNATAEGSADGEPSRVEKLSELRAGLSVDRIKSAKHAQEQSELYDAYREERAALETERKQKLRASLGGSKGRRSGLLTYDAMMEPED